MRRRFRMRRRPMRLRRAALFIALFAVLAGIYAENRLPAVKADVQQAALRAYAQSCIAETVQDYLLERPVTGSTELVSLDTYTLSTIKAELTRALQKALSGTATAWIPVGNLTGTALLNGHGFKIPVFFNVEGVALIDFESELSAAGINRTKYQVRMTVTAELYSSSAAFSDVVSVSTSYPVYESVLEGEVPNYTSARLIQPEM